MKLEKIGEFTIAGVVSLLIIFNVTSGIISVLWLLLLGQWRLLVVGFIVSFIMPFLYSIVMLPGMGLGLLAAKLLEKRVNKIFVLFLSYLAAFYQYLLILSWVIFIFSFYMFFDNIPILLRILAGYSTVMSPLSYMAKGESRDNLATSIGLFLAQISYIILTIALLIDVMQLGYLLLWLLAFGVPVFSTRAIFSLYNQIPKSQEEDKHINTVQTTHQNPRHKKKILLIEKDQLIRDIYHAVLKNDFVVDQASDGEEGLEKLDANSYDLVFLNIVLPGISGLDVITQVKQSRHKHGKIVFVDTLTDQKIIEEAFHLGADGYEVTTEITPGDVLKLAHAYLLGSHTKEQAKKRTLEIARKYKK